MDPIDVARSALETGPVCDSCLGRCVAERGAGPAVTERGWALRVVLCLEADEPYEPVDPGDCWVCAGASAVAYDEWVDRVAEALADLSFETFQVGTRPPEEVVDNDRALRERAGLAPDAGLTFNAVVNEAVGDRLARRTGASRDAERPDVVPVLDLQDGSVAVRINPVSLYGRYRKLEPGIVQRVRQCPDCDGTGTPTGGDGTRPCERCEASGRLPSVEELVAWTVRDEMDAAEVVFQTAGREGVDVLMLGTGRPFVLELKEPRRRAAGVDGLTRRIREAASGRVEVDDLSFATPDVVDAVTQRPFGQRFRLTLRFAAPVARAVFDDAVAALDGATVRRHLRLADLDRGQRPHEVVRTLRAVEGAWRDARRATLAFEVDAGVEPAAIATGDDGGLEPSLAELLGTAVEVTETAVVSVEGRDRPFEDPAVLLD